ncbi:MAG: MASE3 domain-containing protein [Desulfotomaculaceae bacterium]|nr:MASE3 domain-containing protein [Desulfotomaculaceae bacterium]
MRTISIKERLLTGGRFLPKAVAWFLFFIFLVFLAGRYYTVIGQEIYPVLHMLIEFVIVAVAICAALMSWYDYKYKHELKMLLLSLTFCLVAPFEFAHALSYMGMPDFITSNTVDKASTLFIITKLILAVGLLAAVVYGEKIVVIRRSALIPALSFLLSIGVIYLIVTNLAVLPDMYDAASGSQTIPKVFLGYLVIAIEAIAMLWILTKKWAQSQDLYLGMALIIIIMSDLAFIYYLSPYDTYNLLGHIFQVFSFAFIFKAIIDDALGMLYETNRTLARQWEMLAEKNQQLLEADRLKDEFLANTNHELRTPLSAIIAFTEILLDECTGTLNEMQKDYLGEISDSGKELLGRINGFLDLSKIAAGKTVLYKEVLNVYELIGEVSSRIRPLFNQKGITLEIPRADISVKVWGDRDKTGQILTNLLSNALKFTAPGGQVTVGVEQDDSAGVYISVTDTGIGIEAVDQEKIFQSFQQVDGTTSRKYSGTGIGLALAKELVDLHGGHIGVSSEINKGSTFTFMLPTEETEEKGR